MFYIGTSGFSYPHWRGLLYPKGLSSPHWLERYAQVFGTVELNATFYQLPTVHAVERWRESTPGGFVFACKGSRYLTHLKRLRDTTSGLERYFSAISGLEDKLGPILWQLPPQMSYPDIDRLAAFIDKLPREVRHVFEFRHLAWYTAEIASLLDEYDIAICEHDLLPIPPPRITGGFRYLRFHGKSARYSGRYGREGLEPYARDLLAWRGPAFVYFNNDARGDALYDAMTLGGLLGLPLGDSLRAALHGSDSAG